MYVCLCAGVTDTKINRAIDEGCRTLKQLKQATNAMTGCCKCCDTCKELLAQRIPYDPCNKEEDDVCHS